MHCPRCKLPHIKSPARVKSGASVLSVSLPTPALTGSGLGSKRWLPLSLYKLPRSYCIIAPNICPVNSGLHAHRCFPALSSAFDLARAGAEEHWQTAVHEKVISCPRAFHCGRRDYRKISFAKKRTDASVPVPKSVRDCRIARMQIYIFPLCYNI